MTAQHPAYGQLRPITDYASVILCQNPGKMSLDGTNSYLLRAPGSSTAVLVDPGPRRPKGHSKLLAAQATFDVVLITHRHYDHTQGIDRFRRHQQVPVRAWLDTHTREAQTLRDGEVISAAGLTITVVHTPGHTSDSVSFVVDHDGDRAILTGDTILGTGTTVLDAPDGTLRDYLTSLDRLEAVAAEVDSPVRLLPAHGPDHPDIAPIIAGYREHRLQRLNQVRAALDEMNLTAAQAKPMSVVRTVYADVDKKLWPAARKSVQSQLEYLRQENDS